MFANVLTNTINLRSCQLEIIVLVFSWELIQGEDLFKDGQLVDLRCIFNILIPQVLSIHLKRFRHDMNYSSKISSSVSFPVNGLNLKPFVDKGNLFLYLCFLVHFSSFFIDLCHFISLKICNAFQLFWRELQPSPFAYIFVLFIVTYLYLFSNSINSFCSYF